MSLILEALKKSEQQRRLGEAPTLGSPALTSRRRRSLLPVFLVLIVIAAAAGWWTMRTPPAPAVDAVAATPAVAKPSPPAAAPPVLPTKPAKPVADASRPLAANAPAAADAGAALRQTMLDKQAELAKRQASIKERMLAQAPPRPATENPATTTAAAPRARSTVDAPVTRTAPATAAAAPAATPPAAAPAATIPESAAQRAADALPSVWDLPYATRKNIPELKLTMHVYAPTPADRFVVIEGTRHVEGDDLGDGLVLKEIRSDGMILDYKGTRFVFPRDSR